MSQQESVSRRDFFRTGAAAAAAAAAVPALAMAPKDDAPKTDESAMPDTPVTLPTRKLGKTGVDVTILGLGAAFVPDSRYLNIMHNLGIRYIDSAKVYGQGASERNLAKWFKASGKRKEQFIVTKDTPVLPEQLEAMVDERLKNLETDYIDAFFLHGLGDSDHYNGLKDIAWFTDKEWIKTCDKIRKCGKCRFFGFSSHTNPIEVRIGLLNAAAKGSWVDCVLIGADPISIRENAEFNKALDNAHKAGIGLVSMKECLGQGKTAEERRDELESRIVKIFPGYKEKGLSPFTAVLNAMWSDERFACVCSHMDNLEKLKENATACKNFKPLAENELVAVHDMMRDAGRTFCVACDGSCQRAGKTQADLNKIARYVAYAEQGGRYHEARELLKALPPEARDWTSADLAAATCACKSNLDFAEITKRADELMA